jgi:predicted nucleotidyltransferase
VLRLAVFGSMLTRIDREGSDLDLLVEFDPKHGPGWDMFALEESLSKLFGHTVDLNTPGFISKYFRDEVVRSAENLYAQ